MPSFGDVAALARAVERLLLPGECLLCQQPAPAREGDPLICGLCRSRWVPLPAPRCDRCGVPIGSDACLACAEWPSALTRVRSAVWLDESARRAVHHLKYDGWWRAAEAMALAMRGALRDLEPAAGALTLRPVLVPIPLGSRRLRRRGYNQSERIAAALGAVAGAQVAPDLLRRARETPSQTSLTPEERAANVAGAFSAAGPVRGRCVLVDDVFTTGATLLAAAETLHAAGAAVVQAVTFARAEIAVGQS